MRRLVVLALAAALVASACTSGKPPSPVLPSRSAVQAGPETFAVSVDGRSDAFPLAANAYFPHALKVHPGDVIQFAEVFSGEAHTVTFGTLVDRAAGSSPSPTATATGTPPPSALPGIYPQGRGLGRGDLVQAAVQPCFLGL